MLIVSHPALVPDVLYAVGTRKCRVKAEPTCSVMGPWLSCRLKTIDLDCSYEPPAADVPPVGVHLNEASVEERAAQWPQSGVPEAASTVSAISAAREHVIAAHDEQVPRSGCTQM